MEQLGQMRRRGAGCAATARIGWIVAALFLHACTTAWITAYQREQERKEALRPEQSASLAPPVARRPIRMGAFASRGFRAHNIDWQREIRKQVESANQLISPTGARFEISSMQPWEYDGGQSLALDLEALQSFNSGDDLDFVVGFVSALPLFTDSMHQLGLAHLLGKHAVTRGIDDRHELEALRKSLQFSSRADVEDLYLQRLRHKKGTILVHEWGHSIGLTHDSGSERWFMRPSCGPKMSDFSPDNTHIVELALRHRIGPDADESGWRRALRDYFAARGGLNADQAAMLTTLDDGPTAPPPARETPWHGIRPGDVAALNTVIDLLRAGQAAEAWNSLAPLRESYREHGGMHSLACNVAVHADIPNLGEICDLARVIAREDPHPALDLFLATAKEGLRAELLVEACARAGGAAHSDPQWQDHLAQVALHYGAFSCAEAATGRLSEARATELRRDVVEARNLHGVPATARLAPEEELGLRAAQLAIDDRLRAGDLGEAKRRAERAVERWELPAVISALAETLARSKRYREAEVLCARARVLLPTDARSGYVLAVVDLHAGRAREAEEILRQVVENAPGHEGAWKLLADLYVHSGRTAKARSLRERYQARWSRQAPF